MVFFNLPVLDSVKLFFDNRYIPWKSVIAGFTILQFVFESYLSYRQYKKLEDISIHQILKDEINKTTLEKSVSYSRAIIKFSVFSDTVSLISNLIIIQFNLLPRMWHFSESLSRKLTSNSSPTSLIGVSLYFFVIVTNLSTLFGLPLDYYKTFVLEEKFGFNKTTFKLWCTDFLKTSALLTVFGIPVIYTLLKIIQKFSNNFVDYVCLFMLVIQILALTLIPNYIMPLFNKFTPLEDGELKTSIEDLAKKVNFPLNKVLVVNGSKRSSHSNAYFTGLPFTSKRIVLFDTLIERTSVKELDAILCHEIGHWKLNHILYRLLYSQLIILVTMTLFRLIYQNSSFYEAFGFFIGGNLKPTATRVIIPTYPVFIGFILFGDLLRPINCFMHFIFNLISRTDEYNADQYSKNLGFKDELCKALIILHKENLNSPTVDSWYSAYHNSHPTLIERLDALGYKKDRKED